MWKANRTIIAALASAVLLTVCLSSPSQGLNRTFDIYMDQPLVQGSYIASDSDALSEDFNSFPMTGPTESCSNVDLTVGHVDGTCTVADSLAFGASSTSSGQSVGGAGGKMVTGNPGADYQITFTSPKKYVGFWWAAGSNGNTVNFLSNGTVVATMNVDQVYGQFGSRPYLAGAAGDHCVGQPNETATAPGDKCFGNSMDINDPTATLAGANSSKYLKNLYFGNPNGYTITGGGPSTIQPSTNVYDEPFVYIHAFAKNGANFDAVEFVGGNFELDNITIADGEKTPRPELVFVQSVPGNFIVNFDSQGGTPVDSAGFASGGSLNAPASPTRSNYAFAGWSETATGSTQIAFPYSPGVDRDITLYAQWFSFSGISPSSGSPGTTWVTIEGVNLSHSVTHGFGYQTIYYRTVADASGASPGSWTPFGGSEVRDGPGTSVEVLVPALSGGDFFNFISMCVGIGVPYLTASH